MNDILKPFKEYFTMNKNGEYSHLKRTMLTVFHVRFVFVLFETLGFCKSVRVVFPDLDWIWASGIRGITNPQRVLGVKSDGIVGNKTITAVNFAEPGELFQALWNCRKQFLLNITNASVAAYTKRIGRTPTESELLKHTKKRFINGWLNRLEKIKEL